MGEGERSVRKNNGSKELGHNFNSSLHLRPCTSHLTPHTGIIRKLLNGLIFYIIKKEAKID